MARLIDCHSHTELSGHGHGSVQDMVRRAEGLGLHTYCMTEHLGLPEAMDPLHGDSVPPSLVEGYRADVLSERERLLAAGSDMTLVLGAELDWLDGGNADELAGLCGRYEFTLGSVHFLEGLPIDNSDNMALWERYGVDGVWERYLAEWLRMASSAVPFSALAHPDLPKVFGRRPGFDLSDAYAAMADALVARGAVFEVNTAGWRKEACEQYPAEGLLCMLCRRGVPVTVGCDAHRPDQVAVGVERAYGLLRSVGYREVVAPTPCTGSRGEWARIAL